MTEAHVEEIFDDDDAPLDPSGPHQDPVELDDDGNCSHRKTFSDQTQPFLTRCACNHIRFTTCGLCKVLVNLGKSTISWPFACSGCGTPVCVDCANTLKRTDAGIVCHRCDPSLSLGQLWTVIYRASSVDRDRRRTNLIRPLPLLFSTRQAAAIGALQHVGTACPATFVDDLRRALTTKMTEQYSGWISADEARDGYMLLKLEVGLFALHETGTELFIPPQAVH